MQRYSTRNKTYYLDCNIARTVPHKQNEEQSVYTYKASLLNHMLVVHEFIELM